MEYFWLFYKIGYIYISLESVLCVESVFIREKLIPGAFNSRKSQDLGVCFGI